MKPKVGYQRFFRCASLELTLITTIAVISVSASADSVNIAASAFVIAADDTRSARNDVGVAVTYKEYGHSKKKRCNEIMLAENTGRRRLGVHGGSHQLGTREEHCDRECPEFVLWQFCGR